MSLIQKTKSLFGEYDANGSGTIDVSSLGECLSIIFGEKLAESEIKDLVKDYEGKITF